jgi:hypothetical protein
MTTIWTTFFSGCSEKRNKRLDRGHAIVDQMTELYNKCPTAARRRRDEGSDSDDEDDEVFDISARLSKVDVTKAIKQLRKMGNGFNADHYSGCKNQQRRQNLNARFNNWLNKLADVKCHL